MFGVMGGVSLSVSLCVVNMFIKVVGICRGDLFSYGVESHCGCDQDVVCFREGDLIYATALD